MDHSTSQQMDPDQGSGVRLLSPEGVLVEHPDYPLEVTPELVQNLYRDMVLVRRFDREGNALQRQGQLGLWTPCFGQEAAQIGIGRAMRKQDMAFPTYREYGVAWCRGVDPTELLGIFRGTDFSSWDPVTTGFNTVTIVLGNQVPNAAGYAMGQKFDGKVGNNDPDIDEATVVFFGDGATSQGDVHEGMVYAASYDAPVVFYCQNNQWAISTPVDVQTRVPLYQRAAGYGFPGVRVDGNDVLACLAVSRWALDLCRSGNGPVMIEAFTYRRDSHSTSDDARLYRDSTEPDIWERFDPIERVRVLLSRSGWAGDEFFALVDAEADELAARFRAFAVAMETPRPERIFTNVYAAPHRQVGRQRREYFDYLAGFSGGSGSSGASAGVAGGAR